MGINVLQKWLGLLFFFLNSYAGDFEVFKFTKPCRINTSCDLPCRLDLSKLGTVNVLWYNDDHEILSQGKEIRKHYRNLRIEMPALNEWNLRIIKVSRNFEGIYRCKTNEGDILSEITVVIEDKPKVDETKSSSVQEFVTEADVATLNCIFSGLPEPKISWYRGNKEEEIEGIKGHQLVIRNVSRYATDYYTCVATNKHGNAKWHMTLIVKFAPTVSVMDETVYAVEGQEVEMGCMVQASPILSVYWTFNGENVHSLDKYEVEEEKESDIFPVRFVRLRIKRGRLSLRDQGDYACHGFGEDEKPIVAETTLKVFKNSNETSQKVHEKDDSL